MYSTFVGGDMGSCWAQHWAKVNYEDEERYIVRADVIQETCWKGLYESVIADARSMEKLAISEGNYYSRGVALIMQAYGYSLLTEMFGDIPFSEACKGEEGIITPIYDAQEDVYNGIFAMLDSANVYLSSGVGSITATTDLVYAGSESSWQKFGNSLKFRLLMRISGKVDVSDQLQEIIDNRAIFTSSADDAGLQYLATAPNANPIYESIVYGARLEYKVNSVMVDMLADNNDPRLPMYAELNNNDEYRGKPAGDNTVPNDTYNYDNVSAIGAFYRTSTFPGLFMTYTELMFLMAEARENGLITTGTASTYYYAGIASSMAFNDVTSGYVAYIAQANIAYKGGADGLQQIAEQNWIGLYNQGLEAWTEWRRTQFPVLTPAIDADAASDYEIPLRYTYPGIEQSVNGTNYDDAVTLLGIDKLSSAFWWLKP